MTTDAGEKVDKRPTSWSGHRDSVVGLVAGRIHGLQEGYCRPESTAASKAALAQLRRLSSHADPARITPSLDAFAVDVYTQVPERCYPESFAPTGDRASKAEIAVHSAMTLYAIHQQSRHEKMHHERERDDKAATEDQAHREKKKEPAGLGTALGRLVWKSDMSEQAVRRRFAALVTADHYPEFLHHLRTLVRMLRDAKIPLDYGALTANLFTWQHVRYRNGVRLIWSRDFENNVAPRAKDEDQPQGAEK